MLLNLSGSGHEFSIAFYHFGSTFEMLFPDVLGKVETTSDHSLTETAFIPLLGLMCQLDMLPSGSGIFEHSVTGDTAHSALIWCVVKMLLHSASAARVFIIRSFCKIAIFQNLSSFYRSS